MHSTTSLSTDMALDNDRQCILLVEDDDFQRQILVSQLSAEDIDILEASNGQEALELVERFSHRIILILCDLDMPVMDGMEFARHIGSLDLSLNLALLSASDSSMLSSVDTMCRAYGVKTLGTFEKPLAMDRANALLELALEAASPKCFLRGKASLGFSENEIVSGLTKGEIQPFFQAKYDLETNQIVGAEALCRWMHPTHGIQSPLAFVPVLEQGQHIDTLTFSMLRQATQYQKQWSVRGEELSIAINLSTVSLKDSSFADKLFDVVAESGIPPDKIVFEVTETAAMQDIAPALENLARLRIRGFGLSIDDFGTGFASMEQLGRIAFTELKIDRGFVSTMLARKESQAIVEASISMARTLGLRSVAEGVESADEMAMLRELGCDHVQGYLIGKPVDADTFFDSLRG